MSAITNDIFTLEMQILYQNVKKKTKEQLEKVIREYHTGDRAKKIINKMKEGY